MKKLLFVVLLGFTAPAFAAGYVGLGFGQSSVDIDAVPIGGVVPTVEDSDTALKLFGGVQVNQNLGVEVGYIDFGEFSATWDDGIDFIRSRWEGDSIYAAVVGALPLNQNLSLVGKAGFARWDLAYHETTSLPSVYTASETGIDPMFGVGVLFNLSDQFAIRAEFERLLDVGDEEATGQSDVDVLSASAVLRF